MMTKRRLFLNSFALHVIAMLLMTLDHIGLMMVSANESGKLGVMGGAIWWCGDSFRAMGRLSFPLFLFLLAEGMWHTHNKHKYTAFIALEAAIMLGGEALYVHFAKAPIALQSNPFLDLALCLIAMYALSFLFEKGAKKLFALLLLVPIAYMALSFYFDYYEAAYDYTVYAFPGYVRSGYGFLGLFWAIGFYFSRPMAKFFGKKYAEKMGLSPEFFYTQADFQELYNIIAMAFLVLITLALWACSGIGAGDGKYQGNGPYDVYNMSQEAWAVLAAPIIYAYNGKKGYDSRWWKAFRYLYFPVHLVILYAIFSVYLG